MNTFHINNNNAKIITVELVFSGHSFGRLPVIYGQFPSCTFNLISYYMFIRSLWGHLPFTVNLQHNFNWP